MRRKEKFFVFLTARPYQSYLWTKKWLDDNQIPISLGQLIMVEKAEDKLKFIQLISEQQKTIHIDDLSFNHEFNHVKMHYDLIAKIECLIPNYINYEDIKKINQTLYTSLPNSILNKLD